MGCHKYLQFRSTIKQGTPVYTCRQRCALPLGSSIQRWSLNAVSIRCLICFRGWEGFRIVTHGRCCRDITTKLTGQKLLTWNKSKQCKPLYPRGLCGRWVQTRGNQERKRKTIASVWGSEWGGAGISSGCLWGWGEKAAREGNCQPSCLELGLRVGGWAGLGSWKLSRISIWSN